MQLITSAYEKPMRREKQNCTECLSGYFKERSQLTDLCPD